MLATSSASRSVFFGAGQCVTPWRPSNSTSRRRTQKLPWEPWLNEQKALVSSLSRLLLKYCLACPLPSSATALHSTVYVAGDCCCSSFFFYAAGSCYCLLIELFHAASGSTPVATTTKTAAGTPSRGRGGRGRGRGRGGRGRGGRGIVSFPIPRQMLALARERPFRFNQPNMTGMGGWMLAYTLRLPLARALSVSLLGACVHGT